MKISLREFYQQFKALVNTGIYDLLGRPNWSKGDVLFSKVKDGTPSVVSGPLVNFYPIVNTDVQLNDQKSASFKVYQAPGSNKPIIDARDSSTWKYENRAWVKYATGDAKAVMEMPQGRLFSSTVDKQLYYTEEDGVLSNITPP